MTIVLSATKHTQEREWVAVQDGIATICITNCYHWWNTRLLWPHWVGLRSEELSL